MNTDSTVQHRVHSRLPYCTSLSLLPVSNTVCTRVYLSYFTPASPRWIFSFYSYTDEQGRVLSRATFSSYCKATRCCIERIITMSGKGSKSQSSSSQQPPQPQLVSGWQYHQYAQRDPDRYVYIGKDDETREPEFLDYGPKSQRMSK